MNGHGRNWLCGGQRLISVGTFVFAQNTSSFPPSFAQNVQLALERGLHPATVGFDRDSTVTVTVTVEVTVMGTVMLQSQS